jgi:hypothetical protein
MAAMMIRTTVTTTSTRMLSNKAMLLNAYNHTPTATYPAPSQIMTTTRIFLCIRRHSDLCRQRALCNAAFAAAGSASITQVPCAVMSPTEAVPHRKGPPVLAPLSVFGASQPKVRSIGPARGLPTSWKSFAPQVAQQSRPYAEEQQPYLRSDTDDRLDGVLQRLLPPTGNHLKGLRNCTVLPNLVLKKLFRHCFCCWAGGLTGCEGVGGGVDGFEPVPVSGWKQTGPPR